MATDGVRATVCLTIDFDAYSLWMTWGARGSRALARGEFGARVGAPRLLDTLKRYEIPSTWFVPGHTADTFPDVTARIAAEGHEIGNHGYAHEAFDALSFDEVRAVIQKANAALMRVAGRRPVGMRVPAGDFDSKLFDVLLDEGFSYDSSVVGEFGAWWCRSGDVVREDGPNLFGQEIDLVQLPLSFVMNDFNYFEFNYGNPQLVGLSSPEHVLSIWTAQFDYMYERERNGILNVTMHPQCIGWGLRIAMLARFIEHCLSRPGTQFATCQNVAAAFRQVAPPPGAMSTAVPQTA